MSSNQTLLDSLIDDLPNTVSQLDTAIENIEEQVAFLNDDKTAVEHVMSMMTTAASGWMFDKADELGYNRGSVRISGSWGVDNLTDWGIAPVYPTTVYGSDFVTSGAPALPETQHYNRQIDFPVAYDHINHGLATDGTYGLDDKITNLGVAQTLQESNRTAFSGFLKSYARNNGL